MYVWTRLRPRKKYTAPILRRAIYTELVTYPWLNFLFRYLKTGVSGLSLYSGLSAYPVSRAERSEQRR